MNYSVRFSGPRGIEIETHVLDAPCAGIACVRASDWAIQRGLNILPGDLTLIDVREISEREAWSPVFDERQS